MTRLHRLRMIPSYRLRHEWNGHQVDFYSRPSPWLPVVLLQWEVRNAGSIDLSVRPQPRLGHPRLPHNESPLHGVLRDTNSSFYLRKLPASIGATMATAATYYGIATTPKSADYFYYGSGLCQVENAGWRSAGCTNSIDLDVAGSSKGTPHVARFGCMRKRRCDKARKMYVALEKTRINACRFKQNLYLCTRFTEARLW
jgi:hypothetical protein